MSLSMEISKLTSRDWQELCHYPPYAASARWPLESELINSDTTRSFLVFSTPTAK